MADLDLSTRDLVLTSAGALRATASRTAEAVQARIATQRGTCVWDRAFGSTLHQLRAAKVTATFQADLEGRIRDALAPMLQDRRLTGVSFTHSQTAGRWECLVEATDAAGVVVPYTVWVRVG